MKHNQTYHLLITFFFYLSTTALLFFILQSSLFVYSSNNPPQKSALCLAAGRSGGHIIPARTIAAQYKKNNSAITTLFFSTDTPLDLQLLNNRPEVNQHVPCPLENIPRTNPVKMAYYGLRALVITGRIYVTLFKNQATITLTTGGYIALPVSIASWCAGIPVILYELNAIPGSAAQVTHVIAKQTKCPLSAAQEHFLFPSKTIAADYPIRFEKQDIIEKQTARKELGIPTNMKVITIVGGSQGSHFFNTHLPTSIAPLTKKQKLFIIQQTGPNDVESVKKQYETLEIPALIFSFRFDINTLYSAADLCITRAGAGSIFELLFFKKPTIIIPLETHITDHQLDNAYAFVQEHPELFQLLRQQDIEANPELITTLIEKKL